jgi:hypothetical protein
MFVAAVCVSCYSISNALSRYWRVQKFMVVEENQIWFASRVINYSSQVTCCKAGSTARAFNLLFSVRSSGHKIHHDGSIHEYTVCLPHNSEHYITRNLVMYTGHLCFNWAPHHEVVLGEWGYSSTPSLTSALDESEWSASRPGRFTPRERAPGSHWIGSWKHVS